jgi:hypothetical protein
MGRAPRRVVEKARRMLHQAASRAIEEAVQGAADAPPPPAPPARPSRVERTRAKVLARLKALHPMD